LTLQHLIDTPHGIDLGPLQPRLPEVLRTPSGNIDVAPPVLLDALASASRLLTSDSSPPRFTLVGRRQLRSNNSWMKGLPALTGGSNIPTVLIHPDDASDLGVLEERTSPCPVRQVPSLSPPRSETTSHRDA